MIISKLQNDEKFFSKNLTFFRRLYEKSVSLPRLLTTLLRIQHPVRVNRTRIRNILYIRPSWVLNISETI